MDEVIAPWGTSRARRRVFTCRFRQWTYDHVFGPKDSAIPARYSEGIYRREAPDVWLWREKKAGKPIAATGEIVWRDDEYLQHSARNGRTLYNLDYRRHEFREIRLPDGHIDGLTSWNFSFFQAKYLVQFGEFLRLEPKNLKERFWVRLAIAPEGTKDLRLELVPKTQHDARLLSSLVVIVSVSDFEIRALDVRAPNYAAETNRDHTAIEFFDCQTENQFQQLMNCFSLVSCIPAVPSGWIVEVLDLGEARKPSPDNGGVLPP